jgi:hypothetical protein
MVSEQILRGSADEERGEAYWRGTDCVSSSYFEDVFAACEAHDRRLLERFRTEVLYSDKHPLYAVSPFTAVAATLTVQRHIGVVLLHELRQLLASSAPPGGSVAAQAILVLERVGSLDQSDASPPPPHLMDYSMVYHGLDSEDVTGLWRRACGESASNGERADARGLFDRFASLWLNDIARRTDADAAREGTRVFCRALVCGARVSDSAVAHAVRQWRTAVLAGDVTLATSAAMTETFAQYTAAAYLDDVGLSAHADFLGGLVGSPACAGGGVDGPAAPPPCFLVHERFAGESEENATTTDSAAVAYHPALRKLLLSFCDAHDNDRRHKGKRVVTRVDAKHTTVIIGQHEWPLSVANVLMHVLHAGSGVSVEALRLLTQQTNVEACCATLTAAGVVHDAGGMLHAEAPDSGTDSQPRRHRFSGSGLTLYDGRGGADAIATPLLERRHRARANAAAILKSGKPETAAELLRRVRGLTPGDLDAMQEAGVMAADSGGQLRLL